MAHFNDICCPVQIRIISEDDRATDIILNYFVKDQVNRSNRSESNKGPCGLFRTESWTSCQQRQNQNNAKQPSNSRPSQTRRTRRRRRNRVHIPGSQRDKRWKKEAEFKTMINKARGAFAALRRRKWSARKQRYAFSRATYWAYYSIGPMLQSLGKRLKEYATCWKYSKIAQHSELFLSL